MKRYSIVAIVALLISMSFFIFIQKGKVQDRDRADRDARAESQAKIGQDIKKRTGQPDESGAGLAKKPDVPHFKVLTPDEAKRLMQEANRIADITERSKACSAIIEDLCKSGFPEEAWDLIEYGLGQVRKWQVKAFFRSAQVPDEALYQKFKELNDIKEVDFGMFGLLDRHLQGEWLTFLKSDGFKAFQKSMDELGLPVTLSNSLSPSLQSYISDNGKKDAAAQRNKLDQVVSAYQNKIIDSATLGEVLKCAYVLSPEQKMEALDAIKDLGPVNGNLQIYRKRLIADLVRKDPEGTISNTMKLPPSQQSSRDISTTIRSWISADAQGAADWYTRNSSSLNPFQKDSAAGAYYLVAMEDANYDTAGKWIDEMSDPTRKVEAQKMLETALLKRQRKEAPGD
jgi:hypothetical protein